METTIKTQSVTFAKAEVKNETKNLLFWDKVEFMRFGLIPILLTVIGCMGGFAASFGAGADVLKISLIAFPTITSLALMLAVQPMRVIVWASAIAIALDAIVLIF